MTVRWITERLGTSPWQEQLASGMSGIVDVRHLRDASGNSPIVIQEKITEALNYLKRGTPVVICCDHGISRSNAIAAAILAKDTGITLSKSLRRVIQATGENGIKIDLVDDLRKALGIRQTPMDGSKVLVLGLDGFIGRSINSIINPFSPTVKPGLDQDLINNPVLLDLAMEETAANQILFCWHPPGLDTNRAAGQMIASLRNALEVCRVRQAGLIFLSGHQVFAGYDESRQGPFSEAYIPMPAGAAGDSLYLCETLIKQYEKRHALPMLVVRTSYVYGPGDERPGILNTLVRKALSQQEIVTHCYKNGPPSVDLVHVHDLACALKTAVKKQLTGIVHITSGSPIATDELARRTVQKSRSNSKVVRIDMPGNHRMVQLESTLARTVLEWQDTIDFDTGLSELIEHTRSGALQGESMTSINEKSRQDSFPWERSKYHTDYNAVLAHYKVVSCLEHAQGNSLLDLACGDGLMTSMLAEHFETVVGVDASGPHIVEAKRRLPRARFFECLIEDFETDEKFDAVLLLDILEHVIDPVAVLRKAANFLNQGGTLIVHVPNAEAINRRLAVLMGTLTSCDELSPFDIQIAGHRRSYELGSLVSDIEDAELKVSQTGGIFYKILSTAQMDWFLKNGLWEDGGFGWGRVGKETSRDWKAEFCRASYELGKQHPEDCNIIFACATK